VSAITNQGNPLKDRLGGMNFVIGNSSGPGPDGQAMGMYDSVQSMMQQVVEIARDNGDTSTVKRFEKKMDNMDSWALSMRLHSGPVIDEYQKMVTQQGALDASDRSFNRFAADLNASKVARVDAFRGDQDSSLFDAVNQVSSPGRDSSFPASPVQPSFAAPPLDSQRLNSLLNLMPGRVPDSQPRAGVSAGLKLVEESKQAGQDARSKAVDDRKQAQELARVGKLTNMINTMKASGASEDEIARAIFEAENPRLSGSNEIMQFIGKQ
jgi:hypothetical protein